MLTLCLLLQPDAELTALRYDDSGLHCAVGTSNGLVALYDLRSSRPLLVKDHMYGDKITDIKFHSVHGSTGSTGMRHVRSRVYMARPNVHDETTAVYHVIRCPMKKAHTHTPQRAVSEVKAHFVNGNSDASILNVHRNGCYIFHVKSSSAIQAFKKLHILLLLNDSAQTSHRHRLCHHLVLG